MANIDYQHSILWRGEDPVNRKFKPSYDRSNKIARYRAGQAPAWARGKEEKDKEKDEEAAEGSDKEDSRKRERRKRSAPVILEDAATSRLKRLAACQGGAGDRAERIQRHRAIHEAQVLEEPEADVKEDREAKPEDKEAEVKDEEEEGPKAEDVGPDRLPLAELAYDEISGDEADDNELRALKRERARELALVRRKEEEEKLKLEQVDEEGELEDEEESEEESDSEDDPRRATMLKPVFVSRVSRETVKEKEALKRDEEEAEAKEKEKKKERKVESKALVIDEIKRDEDMEREGLNDNDNSDIELIDDNDEKNEAEEYELWKIRELKRIKRDKEEREVRTKEVEWILKRRNMTEEERLADDKRLDDEANKRDEVTKFNFLQKYYHRGGYFQDKAVTGEEPLYLRNFHEPTEEEKFNKEALPSAMQLRRGQFGKKGQVKHTHLTAVDTTDMQAAWSQQSKQVQRYQEKMAGAKGVNAFDRPSASSRS